MRKSEGTDGEKSPLGAVDVILCHIHLWTTEVRRRSREVLRVRSASSAQAEWFIGRASPGRRCQRGLRALRRPAYHKSMLRWGNEPPPHHYNCKKAKSARKYLLYPLHFWNLYIRLCLCVHVYIYVCVRVCIDWYIFSSLGYPKPGPRSPFTSGRLKLER